MGLEYFITSLFAIPVFMGCILEKFKFIQNGFFVFWGSISYTIYLIHQNITYEVEYYLMKQQGGFNLLIGLAGLSIGVFAGLILHYAVEKPLLHIRTRKTNNVTFYDKTNKYKNRHGGRKNEFI